MSGLFQEDLGGGQTTCSVVTRCLGACLSVLILRAWGITTTYLSMYFSLALQNTSETGMLCGFCVFTSVQSWWRFSLLCHVLIFRARLLCWVGSMDGPGIESRWGARFSLPVQSGPRSHPASCTMHTGFLSRVLTTDTHLTPRLKKE